MMVALATLPKRSKNVCKSLSDTFDGMPPTKILFSRIDRLLRVRRMLGFGSMMRPSILCGLFAKTAAALAGSANCTKPKQRELFVAQSNMMVESTTVP